MSRGEEQEEDARDGRDAAGRGFPVWAPHHRPPPRVLLPPYIDVPPPPPRLPIRGSVLVL